MIQARIISEKCQQWGGEIIGASLKAALLRYNLHAINSPILVM